MPSPSQTRPTGGARRLSHLYWSFLLILAACGGGGGGGADASGPFTYAGPEEIVFILPFGEAAPPPAEFGREAKFNELDVYILADGSGSMIGELAAVKASLANIVNGLTCQPNGGGSPPACAPSVFTGVGIIGVESGAQPPFQHVLAPQLDPAVGAAAIPGAPGEGGDEVHLASIWAIGTGQEVSASGCAALAGAASANLCVGVRGGVCFRPNSLAVIALFTDEAPTTTSNCPSIATAAAAASDIGARIVGIYGAGSDAQTVTDLSALAQATGAVDSLGTPIVVDGSEAAAAAALQTALQLVLSEAPLAVRVRLVDEPGDAGDALQFLDRFATHQPGTGGCVSGLPTQDTNADTTPDAYPLVPPCTHVCWQISALGNTTVPSTAAAQVFRARIEMLNGDAVLGTVTVAFVVPPTP